MKRFMAKLFMDWLIAGAARLYEALAGRQAKTEEKEG